MTPRQEGFVSGAIGHALLSCPYRRWGFAWVEWRNGWMAGRFS